MCRSEATSPPGGATEDPEGAGRKAGSPEKENVILTAHVKGPCGARIQTLSSGIEVRMINLILFQAQALVLPFSRGPFVGGKVSSR